MNTIPTFLSQSTTSLLKVFSFGCLGRRRKKHKADPVVDIEAGAASHDEKNESAFLYDPGIEKPVSMPTVDCPDEFVEISLANGDQVEVVTGMAPLSKDQTTKGQTESLVADASPQKPARAKLLDILIQFPLPPSYKESGPTTQSPVTPTAKDPKRLRKQAKQQHGVERGSMDIVDLQASPVLVPLSPVSTRRSSLVWFADKSNYGDDLSTDSANYWVSVQRVGHGSPRTEWITDWRDDLATVLQGFQEIHKQEDEDDFRDILANASVSSAGGSLSRSSESLSEHMMRWSGKWNT